MILIYCRKDEKKQFRNGLCSLMYMRKLLPLLLMLFAVSTSLMAQTNTINTEKHEDQKVPLIDEMPEFTDGDAALSRYIQGQLVYPQKEKDLKVEGIVLVRFAIQEDGTVAEVAVSRGINTALDEEAVRVIKLLPKFAPGKQNGQPVKSYKILPVEFKLP